MKAEKKIIGLVTKKFNEFFLVDLNENNFDENTRFKLKKFRDNLHTEVRNKNSRLFSIGAENYLKNK